MWWAAVATPKIASVRSGNGTQLDEKASTLKVRLAAFATATAARRLSRLTHERRRKPDSTGGTLAHFGVDGDLHRAPVGVRDGAPGLGFARDVGKLRWLDPVQPVRRHRELRRLDDDAGVAPV